MPAYLLIKWIIGKYFSNCRKAAAAAAASAGLPGLRNNEASSNLPKQKGMHHFSRVLKEDDFTGKVINNSVRAAVTRCRTDVRLNN